LKRKLSNRFLFAQDLHKVEFFYSIDVDSKPKPMNLPLLRRSFWYIHFPLKLTPIDV
jgi:hypothetical protein